MSQTTIWEKLSKFCLYALIFLAPIFFLPLTADPIGVNKQAVVILLAALSFIFWLSKTLSEGKIICPKGLIKPAILLMTVVFGISSYLSVSRPESFFDFFGRFDNFPAFLTFLFVSCLSAFLLRTGKDILRAIRIFLCSAGLLVLYQTVHFLLGSLAGKFLLPWNFSSVIDFNPVGTVNVLSIFFSFALIAAVIVLTSLQSSSKEKIFLYSLGVLLLFNIIIIGFWPVWLGLTLAMIFIISYRFIKEMQLAKNKEVFAGEFSIKKLSLPLVVFVVSFLLLLIKPQFGGFLNFAVEIKPTYGATMDIVKQVLNQGLLKSIFGTGSGTFVNDYLLYRSPSLNSTNLWQLTFNQGSAFWPTILATTGYFGALTFILLLIAFLCVSYRAIIRTLKTDAAVTVQGEESQDIEAGLVFGIIGSAFLFLLLFLYPSNYVLGIMLFFSLGILASASAGSQEEGWREVSILSSPQKALIISLALILFVTFSIYFVYLQGKNYVAEIYYGRAIAFSADAATLDKSIASLGQAVNLNPDKSGYFRSLAQVFIAQISQIINQKPSETLTQAQIQTQLQTAISNAINSAQQAVKIDGESFANLWTLGSVYENVILFADGADKQAIQAYEEAFKRNPQSPSVQIDMARTYLAAADKIDLTLSALSKQEKKEPEKEGDLKKEKEKDMSLAKAALEKSISLKDNYVQAHYMFSQMYEKMGDIAKAIEKAQDAKKFAPNDLGAIFQLGRLYYIDNNLEKSQAEFELAIAINPDYSNGRYFLGLIYDKQGFKNKAIAEFERIVKLNPDNKEVGQILENLKAGNPALFNIGQATPPVLETPPTDAENTETDK